LFLDVAREREPAIYELFMKKIGFREVDYCIWFSIKKARPCAERTYVAFIKNLGLLPFLYKNKKLTHGGSSRIWQTFTDELIRRIFIKEMNSCIHSCRENLLRRY
jgi:hypothetical protein